MHLTHTEAEQLRQKYSTNLLACFGQGIESTAPSMRGAASSESINLINLLFLLQSIKYVSWMLSSQMGQLTELLVYLLRAER
jgi:hypothetical protein